MGTGETLLFSTAYFPPVEYMHYFVSGLPVRIETHENFIKQTYRNRCIIYSPNGIQALTVPVERGSFHKTAVNELRIDYSKPWQINHLRALKTSYSSSAFYEFLIDDIESCIMNNFELLLDLNSGLLKLILETIDLNNEISGTKEYITDPDNFIDLRSSISPKAPDDHFICNLPEYFQVFSPESGFIPNLSILDLLFNMGPETYGYLMACYKRERPVL